MAETIVVLARLEKAISWYRGNFKVLNATYTGIILTDIPFATASSADKGNIPRPNTLFNISGYPIEGGNDNELVNSPAIKGRMRASQIARTRDEVTEVSAPPPKSLLQALKEIAETIVGPLDITKLPTNCVKAPVTLKDAVKKVRSVQSTSRRILPDTGKSKTNKEGVNVFDGTYLEFDKSGSFSIAAGGKGLVVDKEGNIHQQGKVYKKEASDVKPMAVGGFPSTVNPISEVIPRQVVVPTLDRLPDFSMLNWAIKVFKAFETVGELVDIKFRDDKWWDIKITANEDFEKQFKAEQEKRRIKGKIK